MLHPALRRPAWRPFALAVLASLTFAVVVSSLPTEQPVRRAGARTSEIAHGAPNQPGSLSGEVSTDPTTDQHGPANDKDGSGGRGEPRTTKASRGDGRAARMREVTGWTGFAFDACRAPSSRKMDRWRVTSPFLGVGIYIGGALRACPQKNLTRGWVRHQTRAGWRLLPIWVGRQASCTSYRKRISSRPGHAGRYPAARTQGERAARGARAAARKLGIAAGTTLWYDLEWFPPGNKICRSSAVRFLSAWTRVLHRSGYRSGVYSSVSAGIEALWQVRGKAGLHAPDRIWFAWENGRRDSWLGREWIRSPRWKHQQRVHQYSLDVTATYGGVRMRIDRNFVDLGGSTHLRRKPARCGRDAAPGYRPLRRGSKGAAVRGAECLLRAAGHLDGKVGRHYDQQTRQAVRSFQRARDLRPTGRIDDRAWTALLASGPRTVLKRGSEGPEVRRLQRALTAALPGGPAVHGHFGPDTTQDLRRYQRRVGIRATGVTGPATWRALRAGLLQDRAKPRGSGKKNHGDKAGRHDRKHTGHEHHGKPHRKARGNR